MPRNDPRSALPIPARLGAGARDVWHGQVTRRLAMSGEVADSLEYRPQAHAVGSSEEAEAMLRGQFCFGGTTVKVERGEPWRVTAPNAQWAAALHSFDWLKHFRAGDGPASRTAARRFVDGWLHNQGSSAGFAWRPVITGERVTSWCMSALLLMENAEPKYRSAFLKSLGMQGRYLGKTAASEADPMDRMRASMGLVYAGLCLPGERKLLTGGLKTFVKAAAAASLSDGGPASHNPSHLLERLARLIQVRSDLIAAGEHDIAARLGTIITGAIPTLRMYQHADGGLGLFHGGRTESAEQVNRVLVDSGESAPALSDAPETGILRLTAGRMTVLLDAASVPTGRYARTAHAAPLSMEVSIGRRRIITNCGSAAHLDAEWETGCRVSAAHSTLTLDDRSPAEFAGSPTTPLRSITNAAQVFDREREQDEDGVWGLAAHDGYVANYGLVHYRRLFVSPQGNDLRGEDTLGLVKGGAKTLERARAKRKSPDGPPFTVRFHLHPDVTAELTEKAVLLTLTSGERWRMIASGGRLALEDSIYVPRPAAPKATKQIVVHGIMEDEGGQVRWALKRIEEGPRDFEPIEGPGDAV